jgi:hypothetical protein
MSKVKFTTKEEHEAMLKESFTRIFGVLKAKNIDYTAGSDDPYANFRLSELEGIAPPKGIMLRVQDKLQRIRSFINTGDLAVKAESVEDALDDVIGYMELLRGLFRETMGTTIPSKEVSP